MIRIGVDTGGTFTDLVLLEERGLRVHKVRSTPDDPARAILQGIRELACASGVDEVIHGSTVATNAVLERKGARVAMITTRGFEDVLRIGRQTRAKLYDFQVEAPRNIVEPELVFGVTERMDATGQVLTPLDETEVEAIALNLKEACVESVAVCLLHCYANGAHEDVVVGVLERHGLRVCASHRVLPEYREFERWSTTALNAYVTPIMARYLTTLERGLEGTRLHVMQSNGGILSARQARALPVRTVLSGPAGGAVGAQAVARASGFERVVLFDMGGTSTDVSLVDGKLGMTSESVVGDFPVRLPMIDIHTVGAGGGSIAYVDRGGSLRVGPRSAGADPGPVCYGKGEELTVSDANLLLGRLPAEHFLGGRMKLDVARTEERAEAFAAQLGLTVERLAEGILAIANANMERAIRAVSVERGRDPRGFALVAFGGAGGMHACEIAASMEMETVIVPRYAGVLSAMGMMLADVRKDYSRTVLRPAEELEANVLEQHFAPMVAQALADLAQEGFAADGVEIERVLDVRYRGQAYEISVPLTENFISAFHEQHHVLYGYANRTRPTEVVNLRVNAAGITRKHSFAGFEVSSAALPDPLSLTRTRFAGAWHTTPIYAQEALKPGCTGDGPAIVAGGEATIVIPPGFAFHVDGAENLIATTLKAGLR
ncbi:N-methylhydantoinase A [Bryocella elongata]|uniref:N-methylhydantoinase A n=1 Tax=Bryocella elongata TaxID=863522 RepID=A0A1H5XXR0_9BACT|nr:hydantoinase/oxoprolinase family protein [Bryocella elongata]SEG16564.1 N-methylhydantoinase A [Bryocella elongata]